MTLEHSYSMEGTFPVTLTVKDRSGKTDSATKTIKVGSGVGPMSSRDISYVVVTAERYKTAKKRRMKLSNFLGLKDD